MRRQDKKELVACTKSKPSFLAQRRSLSPQETTTAEAQSPNASLSSPVCLWLTPRQIEKAGGAVVKALTKVDKAFYADLPYHWRDGEN